MTILKFSCWPNLGGVDASQVEVFTTLTRYTDLANNSDKYRRFITIMAPGSIPYVLTHTGRWTYMTAIGDWSRGTYRSGRLFSAAFWHRNGRDHRLAHNAWVSAKKGDYAVQGIPAVRTDATERWSMFAVTHTQTSPNPVTMLATVVPAGQSAVPHVLIPPTTTTTTTTTGAQVNLQNAVNTATRPVTPRVNTGDIGHRISNLLARAQDENVDPFDLLEDVAVLRRLVTDQRREVDKLEADVMLANEQIMGRI